MTPLTERQWRRRAGHWLGGAGLAALILSGLQAQAAGHSADPSAEEAALQAVCGRCHNTQLVTQRLRPESEWLVLFDRMVELGATGTDEQFDAVGRYILTKLTQVRINEASVNELARLLDIPDSAAAAIVARRKQEKLRDLKDLASVPGLDPATISGWKDRIVF